MEAIAEILFGLLWGLLEILGEWLLQALAELALQGAAAGAKRSLDWRPPSWLQALVYAAFGAFAGWLSLKAAPALFIDSPTLRIANLLLSPLAMGWATAWIRSKLRPDAEPDDWLRDFANAALLALALGLVRLMGAK